MANRLNIVYFSWVKERLGRGEESIDIPDDVTTIGELVTRLTQQDEAYAAAFTDTKKLRFALDQNFVQLEASLNGAQELAIFPPVTGG